MMTLQDEESSFGDDDHTQGTGRVFLCVSPTNVNFKFTFFFQIFEKRIVEPNHIFPIWDDLETTVRPLQSASRMAEQVDVTRSPTGLLRSARDLHFIIPTF